MSQVKDDFEDGAIGPSWVVTEPQTAVTETDGDGQLSVVLDDVDSYTYRPGVLSVDAQSIVGCSLTVEVTQVPDENANTQAFVGVNNLAGDWAGFYFFQDKVQPSTGSPVGDGIQIPYSSVDHRFVRLREESGTLYFEASSDRITFESLWTKATWDDIEQAHVEVFASCTSPLSCPTGTLRIADVNP